MKSAYRAAVLSSIALLHGCSTSTSAFVQSAQFSFRNDAAIISRAPLNPSFQYLRATIQGRIALLVLGYEEPHRQGTIQVWYSAEREVLRLQNGRVVGAVGLTTEWRNVVLPDLPHWSDALRIERQDRWMRMRDTMPGYRFGIRENLVLIPVPPPQKSALDGVDAATLEWFEERSEQVVSDSSLPVDPLLPPARYAIGLRNGAKLAVYGEQCLAPDLCFSWQLWPAVSSHDKAEK